MADPAAKVILQDQSQDRMEAQVLMVVAVQAVRTVPLALELQAVEAAVELGSDPHQVTAVQAVHKTQSVEMPWHYLAPIIPWAVEAAVELVNLEPELAEPALLDPTGF